MSVGQVHKDFLREVIAFFAAQRYLIEVEEFSLAGANKLAPAHAKFNEKIHPTYRNPHEYFAARLFISLVGSFEVYLQEMVSVVIQRHQENRADSIYAFRCLERTRKR